MADLHDRIMQILEGRAAMGAGAPKKKSAAKRKPVAAAKPKRKVAAAKPKRKVPKKAGIRAGISAGISAGKKAAKKNPWIAYVKEYAKLNNMSYSEAMVDPRVSASYHAQ